MAITFDTVNKVVLLDSSNVSASAIWTAWVDWLVVGDNIKHDIAFSQVGGVAPIALYLYLENGWKVRPQEADGITTITGNLLVQGGGSPITSTLGNFNILVNMETPISAQAIEVNTGSGVTAQDKLEIASAVWSAVTRTLTENLGLDETSLHSSLDSYANKDAYKADVSNLSADVNVVEVNGIAVNGVGDFKADVDLTGIPASVWGYQL